MHIEKYEAHKELMEHKMVEALIQIVHEFKQETGYTPHTIIVEVKKHTIKDHESYDESQFWDVERVKTEVEL